MHKVLVVCFLFLVKILASQSPQKISYQGVARSATGAVLSNTTIAVKFDIHRGSALGTIIFTEQHQGSTALSTNAFGLFTTAIGSINSLSGIDWTNGPFFIEVSIDPANETSYNSVGTQELMSVPYALYAEKAGNAAPTPTITINSPNTVSNPSVGSYSINIPSSTVYSAGSGIAINAGVISSTVSISTPTITGSGQATVTSPSDNVYQVNVPTPSLSISGNTLSISPGNTLLLPENTIAAGNSNITLSQSGNAYTITPVTPTLNVSGGTLTGAYPTQTLTIPATSATTLAAGNSNITLNQSGNAYTITPVTPTLNVSGGSLTGSYPTQTLTIPSSSTALVQGTNVTLNQNGNTYTISASSASLAAGNSNITLNQSGNAYTITPVTPTLNVSGGTLTGSYPTQTLTIPATAATTLAAGNSNITLNQSGNAYTITPVTPTLNVNGGSLTGSYPTQTLTIPSSSTALVQGTNVTLNQNGNTYTISASSASLAAGNSNITLNQSGNAYTITPVTPTLNVSGGTLTGSYPTQTLTIPATSATTLAAGNSNITLNQSGNAYTITPVTPTLNVSGGTLTGSYPTQTLTIPATAATTLAAGNSNITLNQSGNAYTITPVTPTLNVNGGTLTGSYPTQTLTIPATSATTLAAGNSNITLNQSGNAYTITPVTPTLNVNGGSLTGSYPAQTLTIPSSSTALVQGTNVTLNQNGNTYTISASTASLAAGNSNITLNQSGNAYTITPVTPTLNVSGGSLTGSYPTQTLTIPSSSTALVQGTNVTLNQNGNTYTISASSASLAAGNSNITLNQSGNAYTITPVTPTLNVSGGTLTGSYPTQTLTIPSSSTTLVQGNNISLNQSGNTYTIAAISPTLTAGTNVTITPAGSANAYTISAATTSYTGTAGNIDVNANTINLAATGVTAGFYGSSAGNAVPFFTVDNFGRLSAAGQYTPTLLGDVTGTLNTTTVSKLRGVAISAVVPTTGQVLQFDGTAWTPTVSSVGWSLSGNSGTTASNFIGTTDNLVFRVKTNSLDRATFSTDNNLTLFSGDNANPGRISMNGNISNTIKVVEAVTVNNGSALSIASGDSRTGTGNSFGGNLNLSAGAATGNGTSVIDFLTAGGGTTGSTRVTPGIKMRLTGTGQLLLGTTGGAGANSKLVVADGHIESTQASAPGIAGAGSLLGLAGSSANLSSNSTDVCGTISIYTGLLGGGGKGNYAVITFDKAYVNPPVVILTPRSEEAAGLRAYVTATSTTGFTLAFSTGTAGLSTYEFNYMILAN